MSHRTTLYRYYRSSSYDLNYLVYWFLVADNELRISLKLDIQHSLLTFLTTTFFFLTIALYFRNLTSATTQDVQELQKKIDENLPKKDSLLHIKPSYDCFYEHLQQNRIFQENAKKELHKEQLEIETLNNRVSCINNLLKSEAQRRDNQDRS